MKGIDIFCASQASTAICVSMTDASSSSSPNTLLLGGRALDRHNPIIRDSRREISSNLSAPCSSQPPISPKPHRHHQKTRKSTSSKTDDKKKKVTTKENDPKKSTEVLKSTEHHIKNYTSKATDSILRRNWVKPPENLITPPGSSRCLLSDTALLDGTADGDPVSALAPFDNKKAQLHQDELRIASKGPSGSSQRKSPPSDQVVVLRVSLHCKGCEGKVRKHLSRMEGVTSFSIDFAAKKVTIVGNVTPLSVLTSVSKVKNAQFWPASDSAVGSQLQNPRNEI